MPYIKQERRKTVEWSPKTPGELNYLITMLIQRYLDNMQDERMEPVKYFDLNQAIGAVECAKLEFYRRIVSPYENQSIEQNGDVY